MGETRVFAEHSSTVSAAHREEDRCAIKKFAANYELHRIAAVDRNILRVAIHEMLHCPDIPPVVPINEAIEIAKKFGTEKTRRLRQRHPRPRAGELKRPAREPGSSRSAGGLFENNVQCRYGIVNRSRANWPLHNPANTPSLLANMAFGFFKSLIQKFTGRPVDWDELEEALIRSDLGVPMTTRILKGCRKERRE